MCRTQNLFFDEVPTAGSGMMLPFLMYPHFLVEHIARPPCVPHMLLLMGFQAPEMA